MMAARDEPGGRPRYLLPTKTQVPPQPRLTTRRHAALFDRLVGWDGVVTVVAPAGYGKTALLTAWAAREERPVAWFALEPEDEDPLRFVTYLVEAVAPFLDPVARAEARGAITSDVGTITGAIVPFVLNTLDLADRRLLLVLDGIEHLPPEAAAWLVVRQLVGYRSPGAAVALAGRRAPPFGLSRARASGRVLEVDLHALTLDHDDLERLVAELAPSIDPELRRRVAETAAGWPAPAVLAARVVGERGLVDEAAIARVVVDEGHDYLAEEVVVGLDDELAAHLRTLAVLTHFDLDVAATALATDDVVALVDELRRRGLVEPVREGVAWRVWSPLVPPLLELAPPIGDDEQRSERLRATARLLADRGDVAEAVELHATVGATDDLVELVAARWPEAFNDGELGAVDDWLRLVGEERVAGDARLLLARGFVALARRDAPAAERAVLALAEVEARQPTDGSGPLDANIAFLRAQVALRFRGDSATGLHEAERAAKATWEDPVWAAAADLMYALALVLEGHDERAVDVVRQARRRPGLEGTASRAGLEAMAAILAAAAPVPIVEQVRTMAERSWRLLVDLNATEWTGAAIVRVALGHAALVAGDLDGATRHADDADRLLRRGLDRTATQQVQYLRVVIALSAGDREAARAALEGSAARLGSWADPGPQIERHRRLAVRLGLAEQDLPEPLTDRELEVLRQLPRHETRADLADALHVSVDTVKTHLGAIYRKLDVAGRDEAIVAGRRLGLL